MIDQSKQPDPVPEQAQHDGNSAEPTPPTNIKDRIFELRAFIVKLEQAVGSLHNSPDFVAEQAHPGQHSEMHANIQLAYRHLEDARMRLGKVVQAFDGGVSCYPK